MSSSEKMDTGGGEGRLWRVLAVAALVVATLAVYWRVGSFDFVNLDDPFYVYRNQWVMKGMHWEGVAWAFGSFHAANWHPLTWLSHMLDVELFGLNAGPHHLVNLALHLANTLLLLHLLSTLTGAWHRSLFVAALFALHPLHVESVAWIAERKDLLSGLFFLLTLLAYQRHVRCPGVARYLPVAACFALGLMAKPMLVTLPFLLLLLDYWPLERLGGVAHEGDWRGRWARLRPLLAEKVPLLLLTLLSCLVTYLAQVRGEAVAAPHESSLAQDVGNAFMAYLTYIGKMIWPAGLAVQYPFRPEEVTALKVAAALLLLASLTAAALRLARRAPYLPVGWFWYLGMMVPVIGFLRVGDQAMADRYTYLPLIGLFMVVAWGGADLACRCRLPAKAAELAGLALVAALVPVTWVTVGYWRDTETLLVRSLAVTRNNHLVHNNLANHLQEKGDYGRALYHVQESLRLSPSAVSYYNLGTILGCLGHVDKSIRAHQMAVHLDPSYMGSHFELGLNFIIIGQLELARQKRDLLLPDHADLAARLDQYLQRAPGGGSAPP